MQRVGNLHEGVSLSSSRWGLSLVPAKFSGKHTFTPSIHSSTSVHITTIVRILNHQESCSQLKISLNPPYTALENIQDRENNTHFTFNSSIPILPPTEKTLYIA